MSFGNSFDAQNAMTSFQTSTNTLGAQIQNQAEQQTASAYYAQGQAVFQETQYSMEQAAVQMYQAIGQQEEGYASAGVEMVGSPMDTINQTRMLGAIQISSIEQQGAMEQQLLDTQGNLAQSTGISDILSSEGQNTLAQEQNQLNQYNQKMQMLGNLLTGGVQLASDILGG